MIEPSDDQLRQWLLHRLSMPDAQMLEDRLMQDETLEERLCAIETDLIDDYTRNRLDDADQAAVASHLLATPGDRSRLRIARALARMADQALEPAHVGHGKRHAAPRLGTQGSPRRRSTLALAASACAALLVVVGFSQRDRIEPTASVAPEATPMTITLLADQQRGADVTQISIPRGTAMVRLQIEVDPAPATTRYTLGISAGTLTLFDARDLEQHEAAPYHFVEVVLAARAFTNGEHVVRVVAEGASAPAATWLIRTRRE